MFNSYFSSVPIAHKSQIFHAKPIAGAAVGGTQPVTGTAPPSAKQATSQRENSRKARPGAKQLPAEDLQVTGFFPALAADMPAIVSSKNELAAVLERAKIRASKKQVDDAWSALVSGGNLPGFAPLGDYGRLAIAGKMPLAGALRNPGFSVLLVLMVATAALACQVRQVDGAATRREAARAPANQARRGDGSVNMGVAGDDRANGGLRGRWARTVDVGRGAPKNERRVVSLSPQRSAGS